MSWLSNIGFSFYQGIFPRASLTLWIQAQLFSFKSFSLTEHTKSPDWFA